MPHILGIPKERLAGERRVLLNPASVREIVQAGIAVLVEKGAGAGIGISDAEYRDASARIVDRKELWGNADTVLKYKAPTVAEWSLLRPKQNIGAIFHAENDDDLTRALLDARVTAFAYEFFEDDSGQFPLAVAGGNLAGQIAVIYGTRLLLEPDGGRGLFLGDKLIDPSVKVLVIGSGNVGTAAADMAARIGARITVLCSNEQSKRKYEEIAPTNVRALVNTPTTLNHEVGTTDLLIGAIRVSTYDTPPMVTEEMVRGMRRGSVIVDVTCGYGSGYMPTFDRPTTLKRPAYRKFGVLHCKIDNLPAAAPYSAVAAANHIYTPHFIRMLSSLAATNVGDSISERAVIVRDGRRVHRELIRHAKLNNGHI